MTILNPWSQKMGSYTAPLLIWVCLPGENRVSPFLFLPTGVPWKTESTAGSQIQQCQVYSSAGRLKQDPLSQQLLHLELPICLRRSTDQAPAKNTGNFLEVETISECHPTQRDWGWPCTSGPKTWDMWSNHGCHTWNQAERTEILSYGICIFFLS